MNSAASTALGQKSSTWNGMPIELATQPANACCWARKFAPLLLDANTALSVSAMERLWGERQPAWVRRVVQANVVRLRQLLPEPADIVTSPARYALRSDHHNRDYLAFRRFSLLAVQSADLDTQRGYLPQALRLWRVSGCSPC